MICQAKDQQNRGFLSFAEFFSVLAGLDSAISEGHIVQLAAMTNSGSGGKIRYKIFLQNLAKDKKPKTEGSVVSDMTDNYNRATLMPIARLIWDKKLVITEIAQNSGMRPRLEVQPSELLSVLKKSGVFINIHQLKALIKEGEGCSALELIKTTRKICGNIEETHENSQRPYTGLVTDNTLEKLRGYLFNYNLSQIYHEAAKGSNLLHVDKFVNYITEHSNGRIKALEAQQSFFRVSHDSETITEPDFCKGFARYENLRQITERLLKVLRTWLRQEKLSTEQGFDYLLQISKSSLFINFENWVKVMAEFDFNLYEASALFDCIDTKQDKQIDIAE